MFFAEILLKLTESAWMLILHLSARTSFPKPLPPQEEAALIEAMLGGDADARDRLIEHNLRLAAHIARKYSRAGEDADDLISIGSIGLIKAVHTFRPEAGRLTTYASRCIENEIRMHLRAVKKLKNTTTMSDSVARDREGNEISIAEMQGTDKDLVPGEVEKRLVSRQAHRLIGEILDEREARVIRLRYGLEDGEMHPQHEVAALLSISRSYVSRIEKKALAKLRNHME